MLRREGRKCPFVARRVLRVDPDQGLSEVYEPGLVDERQDSFKVRFLHAWLRLVLRTTLSARWLHVNTCPRRRHRPNGDGPMRKVGKATTGPEAPPRSPRFRLLGRDATG